MFVIRPKHIYSTPKHIATDLACKVRSYPRPEKPKRRYVYNRDFFMVPIDPSVVINAPTHYGDMYAFSTRNKLGQRQQLAQFVNVPRCAGSPEEASALEGAQFVVRPLRHTGGIGYRVTADRHDFIPGQEYISELFPKRREYRIIFVFGQPLIVLRKKPNEGVTHDLPWGHQNSLITSLEVSSSVRALAAGRRTGARSLM